MWQNAGDGGSCKDTNIPRASPSGRPLSLSRTPARHDMAAAQSRPAALGGKRSRASEGGAMEAAGGEDRVLYTQVQWGWQPGPAAAAPLLPCWAGPSAAREGSGRDKMEPGQGGVGGVWAIER